MPSKPLPSREQLQCPLCRADIAGFLTLDDLRRVVKRLERRTTRAKIRLSVAKRKKAAVGLRRLVVMETGLELNITDSGKRLGLKDLSHSIVDRISEEFGIDYPNGFNDSDNREFRDNMAQMIEKLIVDYFTAKD